MFWLKWGIINSLVLALLGGAGFRRAFAMLTARMPIFPLAEIIILPLLPIASAIVLGWVQSEMLRPYLPNLKRWTNLTGIGICFVIVTISLFPRHFLNPRQASHVLVTLFDIEPQGLGHNQYGRIRTSLGMVTIIFSLTLSSFGFTSLHQWTSLRKHVSNGSWWIIGTVLSVISSGLINLLIGGTIGAVIAIVFIQFMQGLILTGLLQQKYNVQKPWLWDQYILIVTSAMVLFTLFVSIILPAPFSPQTRRKPLFSSGTCAQGVIGQLENGRFGITQLMRNRTRGHKDEIEDVMMMPNGQELLTTAKDGTVRLWQWPCLKEKLVIPSRVNRDLIPTNVVNNGRYIITINPKEYAIAVEAATGKPVLEIPGDRIGTLAAAPNGQLIALGEYTAIKVYDTVDGSEQCQFRDHKQTQVTNILFTPNSKRVLSVDNEGALRVWEPTTCSQKAVFRLPSDKVGEISVDPSGHFVAVSIPKQNEIYVWNLATWQTMFVHRQVANSSWLSDIAFAPNGRHLIASGGDILRIWHWSDGKEAYNMPFPGLAKVTVTPNGRQLIVMTDSGEITVLDWEGLIE